MSKLDKIAIAAASPFVMWAIVLVVEEPMTGGSWATRLRGQPALVSDQAASRLAPAGFDQAQGGDR